MRHFLPSNSYTERRLMQWYPTAQHHTDSDCRRCFVMGFLLLPNTGVFQNRREGHDGRTTKVPVWIEGGRMSPIRER